MKNFLKKGTKLIVITSKFNISDYSLIKNDIITIIDVFDNGTFAIDGPFISIVIATYEELMTHCKIFNLL